MKNEFLDNKIILKYCPEYYRIINEEFDELDYVTDKVIEIYQTYIFSLNANNKREIKKAVDFTKIISRYFDDRLFKKELTNMLLTLKVAKSEENVLGKIIEAIINAYEKYMEGFTRNLYIPKWI